LGVPRLWDLIRSFKQECESQGWKTSQNEDWIHSDNQYHNFLWTRTIHPSTFRRIAKTSKCAMREGIDYHVVDIAYTAWLFSESPPEELWKMITEDRNLAEKVAVYDLSRLHSGEPVCLRLNSTKSKVFNEFESFLQRKLGAKFKTPKDIVTAQI